MPVENENIRMLENAHYRVAERDVYGGNASMKWLKPLGNMVIPALLFYAAYHVADIIPAMVISLVYSLFSIVYARFRNNRVNNS